MVHARQSWHSLDVPFAAKVLGELAGIAADQEVAPLAQFAPIAGPESIESAEPRRALWAAALAMCKVRCCVSWRCDNATPLQSLKGDAGLKAAAKGVQWEAVLASVPEFDGDLPSPSAFLETQGLKI